MRAIVIDATAKTVTEREIINSLDAMQDIVGGWIERATQLPNGDDIFVDEEGLLKGTKEFFYIKGAHQPFAGNGVIVACNEEGETISCKSSIDEILERITFMDVNGALAQADAITTLGDFQDE